MEAKTLQAYAKINLGLDVIRKRRDGYHEVKMIMQNITLHDTLELRKIEEDAVYLHSASGEEIPEVPMNEDNLIYKVIQSLRQEFHLTEGVEAVLTKRIPVAAGMAGGSTDAAAAYEGMNQLFELGLSDRELCERAVKFGADIPYCIMGGTALSEGIGEKLTPLPEIPDCWILVVKPPIAVSTGYVYGNLKVQELAEHPDIDGMVAAIRNQNLNGIVQRMGNVLETVTIPAYPVIETIKNQMMKYGAENALMSGSGPTVFGIFLDEKTAQEAGTAIGKAGLSQQIYLTRPQY